MTRKPGRPSIDPQGAPSVRVQVRLSAGEYDALWVRAQRSRRTLSAVLRCVLAATDPAGSVRQKSPR